MIEDTLFLSNLYYSKSLAILLLLFNEIINNINNEFMVGLIKCILYN